MKSLKNFDLSDICIIGGLGLIIWGIWQIYHPAAFIAVGGALLWFGLPTRSKK